MTCSSARNGTSCDDSWKRRPDVFVLMLGEPDLGVDLGIDL